MSVLKMTAFSKPPPTGDDRGRRRKKDLISR
jgi:hypothetical protein